MIKRKAIAMKKKTHNQVTGESLVHARISNPIFVRKTLLEGAIVGVDILKGYERIKKLENKKNYYRNEIKKIIKDLRKLVSELENEKLPKVPHVKSQIREEVHKDAMIEKERAEREKVKGTKLRDIKNRTHLDNLNEEIKKLQGRIDKL